jgi:hypothetical protein
VSDHIVHLAETSRARMLVEAARVVPATPHGGVTKIARRTGAAPPDELVRRLREAGGGGFTPPGIGPVAALGETFVLGTDLLRR